MILGAENTNMQPSVATSQLPPSGPPPTPEQARTKTMLELLIFMLRGSEGLDIKPSYVEALKKIYASAATRLAAGQYPVLTYWELQSIFSIARSKGAIALKGLGDFGAAGSSTVRAIQGALRKIGFTDIRVSGMLDARTVNAINSIFGGWDDAPVKLRSGALTAKQISASLPAVSKSLKLAIGGAQKLLNADQGD